MLQGFRRFSVVIGWASVFLVTAACGCGNPQPPARPGTAVPAGTSKEEQQETKPPSPDPG